MADDLAHPSDPTTLTTSQLQREIASLKELMQSQLGAVERRISLAHDDAVRIPTEVQKQISGLRELHEERFHGVENKLEDIYRRLEGKRENITGLLMDVAKLHTQAAALHLRTDESIHQATANATAIARLTSEAIAAREATTALYRSQQEAIAKAETANEKRFQSVNEFRAQLGDQARTFMPRTEAEVLFKAMDARLDKVDSLLTERLGQKAGAREGWIAAAGVLAFIATLLAIVSYFKP